jgi:hypothetical protein
MFGCNNKNYISFPAGAKMRDKPWTLSQLLAIGPYSVAFTYKTSDVHCVQIFFN